MEVARNNSDLSLMVELLEAAELDAFLSCVDALTVLMPNNEAISALGRSAIEELLIPGNKDILQSLLLYHILGNELLIGDFQEGDITTLLDGATIQVERPPLQFNLETVVDRGDIDTCNGIIHIIDGVLMPVVEGIMHGSVNNDLTILTLPQTRHLNQPESPRRRRHLPLPPELLHRRQVQVRHLHSIVVVLTLVAMEPIAPLICWRGREKTLTWLLSCNYSKRADLLLCFRVRDLSLLFSP